ncbi:hypothetical protein [Spiroplasma endosymbiont of Nebria brevicollis]
MSGSTITIDDLNASFQHQLMACKAAYDIDGSHHLRLIYNS